MDKPRLLLITASSPEIQRVRRSRVLNFEQITMPYLAARVPPDWHVTHVDEEAERLDWNIEADLVGITFHTPSAHHAYGLAAHFRSRGACVALGGPHVTLPAVTMNYWKRRRGAGVNSCSWGLSRFHNRA